MYVKLCIFEKRFNSTKSTDHYGVKSGWVTYNCNLLAPTSILKPVILIEKIDNTIPSFNYAFIAAFERRYYFINDIVSKNGLWELYLEVDVLGTYETQISNSTQYVLRSSLFPNSWVYDGIYPTTNNRQSIYIDKDYTQSVPSYDIVKVDTNYGVYRRSFQKGASPTEKRDVAPWSRDNMYFNKNNISSGGFILGVLGDDGTGVTFYACTQSTLKTILNKICALRPSGASDLTDATAAMLFNGLQYVTSLTWYPSLPTVVDTTEQYVTSFKVGGLPISGLPSNSVYSISANPIQEYYFNVTVPKHPKTRDNSYYYQKHDYLNNSPYRQANLFFQPFGNIPIDVAKINDTFGTQSIRVNWAIDFTTGTTILRIYTYDDRLIYSTTTNIGVTVPLSNVTVRDRIGTPLLLGYTALSSVVDKFTTTERSSIPENRRLPENAKELINKENIGNSSGNLGSTVKNVVDLGVDAVAHLLGQVSTVGSVESYISYLQDPYVYCWYMDIAQPNPNMFGYPVNETRLLDEMRSVNCYVKCANAYVEYGEMAITMEERTRIIDYLNSGFYLE